MDSKVKKSCPNCNGYFQLFGEYLNLPLMLQCGHSICKKCLMQIIKSRKPIVCKICRHRGELSDEDAKLIIETNFLNDKFPINFYTMGQRGITSFDNPQNKVVTNYFVDSRAALDGAVKTYKCVECHKQTTKMCKHCDKHICEQCFIKIHSIFESFKNHALINIAESKISPTMCNTHQDKAIEYYCVECSKPACTDCREETCKDHKFIPTTEKQLQLVEELKSLAPKLNETFLRLSNTSVTMDSFLKYSDPLKNGALQMVKIELIQHFWYLNAVIQEHETNTIKAIDNFGLQNQESLAKAKENIAAKCVAAQEVMNDIHAVTHSENVAQFDINNILEKAKEVLDFPFHLVPTQNDVCPIKVCINEDKVAQLKEYVSLEIDQDNTLKLLRPSEMSSDIPNAPPALGLPPVQSRYNTSLAVYTGYSHESFLPQLNVGPHEKQKPIGLSAGCLELIYISHIIDPCNIFVQLFTELEKLKNLQNHFRNVDSFITPTVNDIYKGGNILSYCAANQEWQRCRISKIMPVTNNKIMCEVIYIDFGFLDYVSTDQLRIVPPTDANNFPPLAIQCTLANIVPVENIWNRDNILLMQEMALNKLAVIYIRQIRGTENNLRYFCDLTTYIEGVNLAFALSFQGHARIINQELQYPFVNTEGKRQISHNMGEYRNTVQEVYITSITNPDQFFIRRCNLQRVYVDLCSELEASYSLNSRIGMVFYPTVGMFCVVNVDNYTKDVIGVGWRRGWVQDTYVGKNVLVQLIDTGEQLIVHADSLRTIHIKFTTLNALAFQCKLDGIIGDWNSATCDLLKRYLYSKLEMRVGNVDESLKSLSVVLYEINEDNKICINQEINNCRFSIITNRTNLKPPQVDEVFANIMAKPTPVLEQIPPQKFEVQILSCHSPSLLYVAFKDQAKQINELHMDLQFHYSFNEIGAKNVWEVGDKCCAKGNESNAWKRATILELDEEKAKLFFVDIAIIETVRVSDLKELFPKFSGVQDAAFKCHLSGIMPGVGDDWPRLTTEHLRCRLGAYNRFFITKSGAVKNNSLPIELWAYCINEEKTLNPNKPEWLCLNHDIIHNGHGITIQTIEPRQCEIQNIDDSLQVEAMPEALLIQEESPKKNIENEEPLFLEDIFLDDEIPGVENIAVNDWLSVEPFNCSQFVGNVSYVDSLLVLYVHARFQAPNLQLIRNALDNFSGKPGKLRAGDIGVARFHLDMKMYRIRAMAVAATHVNVRFVDYGNKHMCDHSDIMVAPQSGLLRDLPVQAHRCLLAHVRPKGEQWDMQAVQYINQMIVHKETLFRIVDEPIGDLVPVEVRLEDNTWLHYRLIQYNLAIAAGDWKILADTLLASDPNIDSEIKFNKTIFFINDRVESGPQYEKNIIGDWFQCVISGINSFTTFTLKRMLGVEIELRFRALYFDIQKRHHNLPQLESVHLYQPCIALYATNNLWCRGLILEHNEEQGLAKVKYIDLGVTEILPVNNLKKIGFEWVQLLPATVSAKLYQIEVNHEYDEIQMTKEIESIFMDKLFYAKVIDPDSDPIQVELTNEKDGEIVYKNLINKGVYVETDPFI